MDVFLLTGAYIRRSRCGFAREEIARPWLMSVGACHCLADIGKT